MAQRIFYDGLNLSLAQGTGIATYTRMLIRLARELGNETGAVYSLRQSPSKSAILNEIAFFDTAQARISRLRAAFNFVIDQAALYNAVKPVPVDFSGVVVTREFDAKLAGQDRVFFVRNLFNAARSYFARTKRFVNLVFDEKPDILHCTYQLPLQVKSARNVYTIHDLVPLRLPYTTLDKKREMYRLLRKIAAQADHIVTVSENSRKDIIQVLGVEETRVTNTYQAVEFPRKYIDVSENDLAQQLGGAFDLDLGDYLLFFGALEPKKNVGRLIEAYLASGVDTPLVLVTTGGWQNEAEVRTIAERQRVAPSSGRRGRGVLRFEYVNQRSLVMLIKGARAVLFPSLYEGFGLPVLESMVLGTPVVTSRESSLPEVAGDAALLVDPYDVDDLAKKIRMIAEDGDLRTELSQRGKVQAEKFSVARYQERVRALYDSLT